MGMHWRGLLALVNKATADGRRFRTLTWRKLPLGLNWQPAQEMGHDASVVIGSVEEMHLGTTAEAIAAGWISEAKAQESGLADDVVGLWGSGQLLDDVDPAAMPRLAQNVAEAKTLLETGVVAPSIDAIAQGAIMLVEPGQDEPPTAERMDEMMEEYFETGVEPPLEVLFEEGLVAAATLVVTPAFSEVRPFELLASGDGEAAPEQEPAEQAAATQRAMALTAAAPARPPADLFVDPGFDRYTEIHVVERPDGLLQVAGHYAPHASCHLGIRDVCVAPPTSQAGYVPFHRNVIDLDDGTLLGVGRITTGFGRVGTGCAHEPCRRGKADHACESMSLAQAIAHHDQQTPLAWVRAGEDEHGLYVVGVADADLSAEGRKLLEGRKFSGDWREHGASLELVELLALASGSPAFPAPRAHMRGGRQVSLTASYPAPTRPVDKRRTFAREVADLVVADLVAAGLAAPSGRAGVDLDSLAAAAAVTAATEGEHTGAMIALRMSEEDAARLAVEGGEPVGELHLTLAYLGEGADIDQETRTAIIAAAWDAAEAWGGAVSADVFSVSAFNPGDSNDRDTAIVYGVGGEGVETAHTDVRAALDGVFAAPDQHAPFAAHVTAAYSDDLSMVEELADRTGPIVFDRLRVAFAGEVTDIALGKESAVEVDEAASLLGEITAAVNAPVVAGLLRELEGVGI